MESLITQSKLSEGSDSLSWSVTKQLYVVKRATELFQGPGEEVSWQFIWRLKIFHKIKMFLWKVHLNIIPTNSFLLARGIISKDLVWCVLCKVDVETSEHLFF